MLDPKPTPPRTARAVSATWRLLVLVVVIAGLSVVMGNSLRVYLAQADQIAALRAEISAENERIADLNDKLNRWEDPAYVRSVARTRLGWVMPDEIGYRVIGPDGKPLEGGVITPEEAEVPAEWWDKMWGSVRAADAPAPVEEEKEPEVDDRIITVPTASPSPTATPSR